MSTTVVIVADNDEGIIAAVMALPVTSSSISYPTRFNIDNTKCAWGLGNSEELFVPDNGDQPGTQSQLDALCAQYGDTHLQQFSFTDPNQRNAWKAQVLPTPWVDPDE